MAALLRDSQGRLVRLNVSPEVYDQLRQEHALVTRLSGGSEPVRFSNVVNPTYSQIVTMLWPDRLFAAT